ncbi:MAG: RdgB/HAM1 family non-canonical purine NTP pyrophosphatase [Actinobacteria bacterium]|nr:RdgB/HAM1 family non-canonical purine NTP pyrophosphatase [Actinomycetota bacterium]
MKYIVVASTNSHKIREIESIMLPYGYQISSLLDYPDLPDVQETGATFEENALLKAQTIARLIDQPVLADDSGIEVDALNQMPGVLSARWAGSQKNDQANLELLLSQMSDVPKERRTGRYVCIAAYAEPNGEHHLARAEWEGEVAFSPLGSCGFGYDPIFYLPQLRKTVAQLTPAEKDAQSHRRKAFALLAEKLTKSDR